MTHSPTFRRLLQKWYFIAIAFAQVTSQASAQDSRSPTDLSSPNADALVRDIETAWSKRSDDVTSVNMECRIERLLPGGADRAAPGPFFKPRPANTRLITVTAAYAYERGKISLDRSSDIVDPNDPKKVKPQRLRIAFDGQTNAMLVEDSALPMGTIERNQQQAGPDSCVHSDFLAIGLWLYPKDVFRHTRWSVSKMSVEEGIVDVNGVKCRRLRIPRQGGRWTSTVDVALENAWVPVQWQTWCGDKLTLTLRIDYSNDKKFGPVVKAWNYFYIEDDRKTIELRNGRITKYAVNSDVDDTRFSITFPVGTHVTEISKNGTTRHKVTGLIN